MNTTEKAVLIAAVALTLLWIYVWLDTKIAERRWRRRPPGDWRGSCLRDRSKDRAFPPKKHEYPKRKEK